MHVDSGADAFEDRQHRGGAAGAVAADDVGARVLEPLAGLLGGATPSRVEPDWWIASVITAGLPVALITSSAITASSPQSKVSPTT